VLPDSSEAKEKDADAFAESAGGAELIVVSGGSVSPASSGLKAVQSNWMLIDEPW
jgi:hypothetical protein